MPSSTIYSRRLRSHTKKGEGCRCKVGSCHICGSKCRRCMCSCDGIDPTDALSRSRGAATGDMLTQLRNRGNLLQTSQPKIS